VVVVFDVNLGVLECTWLACAVVNEKCVYCRNRGTISVTSCWESASRRLRPVRMTLAASKVVVDGLEG
jgi:hypothetical protein